MEPITEVLVLEKAAKNVGSDKYKSPGSGFVLYIPQHISRPKGTPLKGIVATFKDAEEE